MDRGPISKTTKIKGISSKKQTKTNKLTAKTIYKTRQRSNNLIFPFPLQVQQLVSEGLLFRWLGVLFSKTDTPFLGSVVIGSLTASLATLADVSWLLVTGAAAKILFDLLICTCSLLVHYGVGLPQPPEPEKLENWVSNRRKIRRKRRRRHK